MARRQTAIDAYDTIKANGLLSKRRWEAYDLVFRHGPLTSGELDRLESEQLGIWTRGASPRLNELVKLGVIAELPPRRCTATGQTVIEYDVTGKIPSPEALSKKGRDQLPPDDLAVAIEVIRQEYHRRPPGPDQKALGKVYWWLHARWKRTKGKGRTGTKSDPTIPTDIFGEPIR